MQDPFIPSPEDAIKRVVLNLNQFAFEDIGYGEDLDYHILAVNALASCGYPLDKLESFTDDPGRIDSLNNLSAVRDVHTVVDLIKKQQDNFYERVAGMIPWLFNINPSTQTADEIKDTVYFCLPDFRFATSHISICGSDPIVRSYTSSTVYATAAIANAIKKGIFKVDLNYAWINHRVIKHTVVAIMHGLLRWANGRYVRPAELVSWKVRIGMSNTPYRLGLLIRVRTDDYRLVADSWNMTFPGCNLSDGPNSAKKACIIVQERVRNSPVCYAEDFSRSEQHRCIAMRLRDRIYGGNVRLGFSHSPNMEEDQNEMLMDYNIAYGGVTDDFDEYLDMRSEYIRGHSPERGDVEKRTEHLCRAIKNCKGVCLLEDEDKGIYPTYEEECCHFCMFCPRW